MQFLNVIEFYGVAFFMKKIIILTQDEVYEFVLRCYWKIVPILRLNLAKIDIKSCKLSFRILKN